MIVIPKNSGKPYVVIRIYFMGRKEVTRDCIED
jgi:hypothetical protein